MAFRERFKDKMQVVGKDGAAAPAPQQAGVKANSRPMQPAPMPMPMPMMGAPPQQQAPPTDGAAAAPPGGMMKMPMPMPIGTPPASQQAPPQSTGAPKGEPSASTTKQPGRAVGKKAPVAGRQAPGPAPAAKATSPSASGPPGGMPMPMPMGLPMPMGMPAPQTPPNAPPQQQASPPPQQAPASGHPAGSGAAVPKAGRRAPSNTRPGKTAAKTPVAPPPPQPSPQQQQHHQQHQQPTGYAAPAAFQQFGQGMQMGMPGMAPPNEFGLMQMPPGPGAEPDSSPRHRDAAGDVRDTNDDTAARRRAKDIPPAPLKTGEAPKYTPYSVDDFRRINKPVRMGGLGPNDSDEVRAARERREKAMDYANNNNRVNLVVLAAADDTVAKKPLGRQPSKELQEAMERRQKMKEFAKNVPKPTVKKDSPGESLDEFAARERGRRDDDSLADAPTASNEKLMELEARHQKDQEMIAAMKRQLGLASKPNPAAPAPADA